MKITILGSGTAFPDLNRNSAGVLIENEGIYSLVDFGYGNVHQLLRLGISYRNLDQIFFTHHHPDHMCDLIYFLFGSKYPLDPRIKDLKIIAGPGFNSYFNNLMEAFNGWLTPDSYNIEIIEHDQGTQKFNNLLVTAGEVSHIEMSRAFRFEDTTGKSCVISGDTDYSQDLVKLSEKVDLLILECSTPDSMKIPKHLTPKLCGQIARESQCRKLLLTHFYPSHNIEDVEQACRTEYNGDIIISEDLTVAEI